MSRLLIPSLLIALSVEYSATAVASEPIVAKCDMFAKVIDLESLKKMLGPENIAFERLPGAEGEESDSDTTVIYPKDRTRRAYVYWKDEKAHSHVASLTIHSGDDADPLAWHYNGLSIESGLAEIEALNSKPFVFSGFGWDYGGFITDWKGGKLQAADPSGCHMTLRLTPGENINAAVIDKVSGEKKFLSSDAKARAAKPHISEITIEFP